jgi:hypothetical protein
VYPWESYLVFIVSEQGIEFNAEKIEAILTMERPRCIRDVERLAGCIDAVRRFV